MSYSILHHLCNCSLASNIYLLLVGTHVGGTDPCFNPEEELASAAADFGRALAKMKCPRNYLSGLTKYVLTSSILPIPVAMAMFCTVDVLSMFVHCLFQYCTLCDELFSSISPIPATNLQYITQDITKDVAHLLFLVDANPVHVLTQGHNGR